MKTKLFYLLLFVSLYSFGQTDSTVFLPKQSFSFEIGGNTPLLKFGYERIFYQKKKLKFAGSAGVDLIETFFANIFDFPKFIGSAEADMLIGRKKNFLEIGIGNLIDIMPTGYYPRHKTEWYAKYGGPDTDGFQYGIAAATNVNYYEAKFNLRIGYRNQKADKKFYWRISWVPTVMVKLGYKMEPYDKFFRIRGTIWSYDYGYKPIPSGYHPLGRGVESICKIYMLNGGFTLGLRIGEKNKTGKKKP